MTSVDDEPIGQHGGRRSLRTDDSGNLIYEVQEPVLDKGDLQARAKIQEVITKSIEKQWRPDQDWSAAQNKDEKHRFLRKAFERGASKHGVKGESAERVWYHLRRDLLGFSDIDILMQDPELEDISCNGPNLPVYVFHREHGSMPTNIRFGEERLNKFILRLAQMSGKQISIAVPILDCSLPDGSRLQATMRDEVTTRGSTFTIRRYSHLDFHPGSLVNKGTYSPEMMAYLWYAIERGANVMVAGTTASGKTTSLNVMSLFIPEDDKIVSIEDTREIDLYHENWIPGITRGGFGEVVGGSIQGEVDMFDLLKAALRMRPDHLIVSEVRGKEAHILFQAMATGHATMSTIHAADVDAMKRRLLHEPINVPPIQLENLDIVVVQVLRRDGEKSRRIVREIAEIEAVPGKELEPRVRTVFKWDDGYIAPEESHHIYQFHQDAGLTRKAIDEELERRTHVVRWMAQSGCDARTATDKIRRYQHDPEAVLASLKEASVGDMFESMDDAQPPPDHADGAGSSHDVPEDGVMEDKAKKGKDRSRRKAKDRNGNAATEDEVAEASEADRE